jgi:hypothetical protein
MNGNKTIFWKKFLVDSFYLCASEYYLLGVSTVGVSTVELGRNIKKKEN